jgi:hypothetical protein
LATGYLPLRRRSVPATPSATIASVAGSGATENCVMYPLAGGL